MKYFLLAAATILTVSACSKDSNNASTPAPTKVDHADPASIPGAWMEESSKAAYEVANSQHPEQTCALVLHREGNRTSMDYSSSYLEIANDGAIQNCNSSGGVGSHGEATPITFKCEPQPGAIELATGSLQPGKPNCNVKFSANDTRAIMSGTCDGQTQTVAFTRVTPKGFENYITVVKNCMVNDRR